MPEGRSNIVNRLAQRNSLGQEVGGQIRAPGGLVREPVGVVSRQRLGVLEPSGHMLSLAKVVFVRGEATAGLGVGEVEREVVGDQRERTGAGGRENVLSNCHYDLYRL